MPPHSPYRVDPCEYPPDDELAAPTRYALAHATDNNQLAPPDIRDIHVPPPPPERPGMKGPVCLANVPASNLDWLWPGRIPLGKLTLLVGDPGAGKSLVALDIAARVTTGAAWPDEQKCGLQNADCGFDSGRSHSESPIPHSEFRTPHSPLPSPIPHSAIRIPHSVLLLSAEDDLADTIRPRLEAAGADLARIIALPAHWSAEDPQGHGDVEPGCRIPDWRPAADRPAPPRPLDLRQDLHVLNNLLMQRPDCRLIIIDPLSAYLGKSVDNFNSEVRRLLAPLAALAARRQLAILAISHLRKQAGAVLHRTLGSLAFTAAARAVWLVAQEPRDRERRLVLPVKNNLAGAAGGLSFTITSAPSGNAAPGRARLPPSREAHPRAPAIEWSADALALTPDEALRPPGRPDDQRDDARRWLQHALAAGATPSREIEETALANGLRLHTLRRAFRDLGGEAIRHGFGPFGQWFWRLPGIGNQEPNLASDALWPFNNPEPARTPSD